MESTSYTLSKKIVEGLENNLENLYQVLIICDKECIFISSDILRKIIEHPRALSPSKVLSIKLLSNSEKPEEIDEVVQVLSSIRVMFKISEILKEELEGTQEIVNIPSKTVNVLDTIGKVLRKITQKQRDSIVCAMEQAGILLLVNVWSGPDLLRFYSSIFLKIMPETVTKNRSKRGLDSIPYRTLVEESIYDKSTILVHRRGPLYFLPKYFSAYTPYSRSAYNRIFQFQDEYEVIHKSLVKWCGLCGDLKTLEWTITWHINNLSKNIDVFTYEKEVLFVLGTMFHSSVMNTLEESESVGLFTEYLELIRKSQKCSNPRIKGVAVVSSQRISCSFARFFISKIKSSMVSKSEKILSVKGLERISKIVLGSELMNLGKIVEKESTSILQLVEIQPEEEITEHCTTVIQVLSILEKIPLSLFSPSKMSLVLWVFENGKVEDKTVRKWLDQYLRQLPSVYNMGEENIIARALCF